MGTASARSVPPWALISCWTRRSASRKGSDRIMDIGIPPVGVLVWFCRGRLGGWSTAAARLTGVVAADRRRWPIVSGIGAHRSQSLQGGALGVVGMEGQDHLHGGHQVPRGPAWHPAPRDPDPGARGRAGGYGYGCRPVGQRGGDRRAQCGFSHSQGQAQHQVTTLPGEPAVLLKADPGEAGGPARRRAQSQPGSLPDPGGHPHRQLPVLFPPPAPSTGAAGLGRAGPRSPTGGTDQVDRDGARLAAPTPVAPAFPAGPTRAPARAGAIPAHRGLGEPDPSRGARDRLDQRDRQVDLEILRPRPGAGGGVDRRTLGRSGPAPDRDGDPAPRHAGAVPVIVGPTIRVAEDLIGASYVAEAVTGGFRAGVGVEAAGQGTKGPPDLGVTGRRIDAEDLVPVRLAWGPDSHGPSPPPAITPEAGATFPTAPRGGL